MIKMENDANWLVIRVPRMYADKVQSLSISRIITEAIRVQDELADMARRVADPDLDDVMSAYVSNNEELELIRLPVDAFSNAVREGFQLEQMAQSKPNNSLGVDDGATIAIMMLESIIKLHPEQFTEIARRVDELMPGHS